MRRFVSASLAIVLAVSAISTVLDFHPVKTDAVTVPDDYPTIQEAVNHAAEGDVVFVRNGTYIENVIVNKTLSLIGESRDGAIIDGGPTGYAVLITANNASITRFTLRSSDEYGVITGWGISGSRIAGNNILTGVGIGGSYNVVSGNIVSSTGVCVQLWSPSYNNTVEGNTISLPSPAWGIELDAGGGMGDVGFNVIAGNEIANRGGGSICLASYLGICVFNSIYHNNVINSTGDIYDDSSGTRWDNGCEGNYWSEYGGIDLDGDGVGDTCRPWAGVDYYPLVNEYWSPADVNHDLEVNIQDVAEISSAYGSTPSGPQWNPHADIASPYEKIDILDLARCTGQYGQKHRSRFCNPIVVGAWWDTWNGSEWSDQQLLDDVQDLKWMNFTAIYCVEKSIMNGSKDDALNETWTARMVNLAEQNDLKIVWAVWETDNPSKWSNTDLDNPNFRYWFAGHLTKWRQFIAQHPCIIGIVFDDFGVESQLLNMTEFTWFVRQYIPLPAMIEFDDRYDSLNPQYGVATVTEGYVYYYQDSNSWSGFWIDYINEHYAGRYPSHTLGICLEAFDAGMGGWTPEKHRPLIDKALGYGFTHYEYWAWRWHTPESPAMAAHPEYWQGIKENNEYILTQPPP